MKKIFLTVTLVSLSVVAMEQQKPVVLKMKKPSAVNDVQSLIKLNGDGLLSATDNKTIEMWMVKKGRHLFTLKGHSSAVKQIAVSNNEFEIYGRGSDKTIHKWSTLAGSYIGTLNNKETYSILCAPITKKWVATVPVQSPEEIHICGLRSKKPSRILKNKAGVTSLCMLGENFLCAGLIDGTIQKFNAESGVWLQEYKGHTLQVQALSSDEDALVSGSYDKTVRLWNVKSGRQKKMYKGPLHEKTYWVYNTAVANYLKQKYIAANVGGAYINIWHKESGKLSTLIASQENNPLASSIRGLCTLDNGQKIAYGTRSGKIMIHSLAARLQGEEKKASL